MAWRHTHHYLNRASESANKITITNSALSSLRPASKDQEGSDAHRHGEDEDVLGHVVGIEVSVQEEARERGLGGRGGDRGRCRITQHLVFLFSVDSILHLLPDVAADCCFKLNYIFFYYF